MTSSTTFLIAMAAGLFASVRIGMGIMKILPSDFPAVATLIPFAVAVFISGMNFAGFLLRRRRA